MSLPSFSQTSNSCPAGSQCIPTEKLQIAARLIQRGKLDSMQVILLVQKIDTMQAVISGQTQRLLSKDSVISSYRDLDLNCTKLEANYLKDISNLEQQNTARQSTINDLNRRLGGQRRKTIFVGITGVAVATVITFLLKH